MPADDWNPEAMPAVVTDPDVDAATEEGQERFRKQRLDHLAAVEAHRGTPERDPKRAGAFDQKPDIQQQQVELWAYKSIHYFETYPDHDWPQFIRSNELPEVWVNTLVKPRAEEIRAKRMEPGVHPGLFAETRESPEVQLEGGPAPEATGATGHVELGRLPSEQTIAQTEPPPERVIPSSALRQAGEAALLTALKQIEDGIHVEAALIERLERLAGL